MKLLFFTALVSLFYTRASYALPANACELRPEFRDAVVDALFFRDCESLTGEIMASVRDLELAKLSHLYARDFEGFPSLRNLDLAEIDAKGVDPNALAFLPVLQYLNLAAFANAESLPNDLFRNRPGLAHLTINGVKVSPEKLANLFRGLSELESLTLSVVLKNDQILPPEVFAGLSSLKKLTLFGGNVLGDESLSGLSELEEAHFWLRQTLQPGAFRGLSKLQRLTLHGEVGALPAGVFSELASVKQIFLYAQFTSLARGRAFDGLNALTYLEIRRSKALASLLEPSLFAGASALEQLVLMENNLQSLPEKVFRGLPKLQLLNLARNRITAIDDQLFVPKNFPRSAMIYLGFSHLSKEARDNILSQHGERVAFDCGNFSLNRGWEYCPI